MKKFFQISILCMFTMPMIASCGGGGGRRFSFMRRPVDVSVSNLDLAFDGRQTRFVFVVDQFSGVILTIDQDKEDVVDTEDNDGFDETPIPVGGEPVALSVEDRPSSPRIFVADGFGRQILAYDISSPADPTADILSYAPVDLGGLSTGRTSRALFKNSGRASSPVISPITVNPQVAQNESWEVKFEGSKGYKVEGSKSGQQVNRAFENQDYQSDNGAFSFEIASGGERTNSDDLFRFITFVTQPLSLTGRPVDMQIDAKNLYIVTTDPALLIVLNLESLTVTNTISLSDGSGVNADPNNAVLGNNHLYISNSSGTSIFDVNLSDLTVLALNVDISTQALGLDAVNQTLYLFPFSKRQANLWNLSSGTTAGTISLTDFGLHLSTFDLDGVSFGLVSTSSGWIDVLRLNDKTRVDTRISGGDTQSDTANVRFSDTGLKSDPELISVTTKDNVTRTERWQLVYEGVIPNTRMAVTISGNQLSISEGSFASLKVQGQDLLVLDPTGSSEEVLISEVTSAQTLSLASAPAHQGSVEVEVRASKNYVAVGSESGVQMARVLENTPYTSDEGAISLTLRASRNKPTTREDYFTFLTIEGIDPIGNSDKRIARKGVVFVRPGQTDPTAYVVEQGSGVLSALDLRKLRVRKTIF